MPGRGFAPARWLVIGVLAGVAVGALSTLTQALDIPPADGLDRRERYLEIVINGISRDVVLELRREDDGAWTADALELQAAGLLPVAGARRPDGRIDLSRLPGVRFIYDEAAQSLEVVAEPFARAPLIVAASSQRSPAAREVDDDFGGLLNYSLMFNPGYTAEAGELDLGGLSGAFEARLYGPLGVLSHQFLITVDDPLTLHRQNTSWRYTEPVGAWRVTVGDMVSGSLDWTRPTRLAGIQFQHDFSLRPDVVTFPVPGLSGSAALPSTAEVYVNGVQRFSRAIPDGPFTIEGMPLATGPGTAVIVVRDQNGREVTIERPYFVSDELLRSGLLDYSMELGFPRSFFGTDKDQYDPRLMASASIRYGLTDWLTVEGHAEGGSGLVNAGVGATFNVADRGVAQFALTGSLADGVGGFQAFGGVSFELMGTGVRVRMQRTFGEYSDIASYTYPEAADAALWTGAAPVALDQIAVDLPLPIESLRLSLNYTELETIDGERQRLVGMGFNQPLWGGFVSASGAVDIDDGDYRTMVGYSRSIDGDMRGGTYAGTGSSGMRSSTRVGVPLGSQMGDVGWQLRYGTGEHSELAGAVEARLPAATTEASLSYDGQSLSGSARVSGAIIATEAGFALANPISDAFAVVDAGYAGVPVLLENQQVGITGADGKFIVTGLRAYEPNRVGIDSRGLPLDAVVLSTRQDIMPGDRSGVVAAFGGTGTGGSALVTFRQADGQYLPVGTTGQAGPEDPVFMVGYDGQALVIGLHDTNRIEMTLPNGQSCVAAFDYSPIKGAQVSIPDVICRPV